MRLRRSAPSQNTFVPSAFFTTIIDAWPARRRAAAVATPASPAIARRQAGVAGDGALGAEKDVGLGDLEVAGLHEFLLHHVLNLLDVDEGLFRGMDALGDGLGDGDGGRGVALEREEGFADGDLDLLLVPRHDLVVAADDAKRGLRGGSRLIGDFARAIQQEALGDEVGVVVDEGFLEQLVEGVEREADAATGVRASSARLAATSRQMRATQARLASVKMSFSPRARWTLVRALPSVSATSASAKRSSPCGQSRMTCGTSMRVAGEDIAPGVVGFLIDGSVDGAFEREIGGDGRSAHGTEVRRRRTWETEGDGTRGRRKLQDGGLRTIVRRDVAPATGVDGKRVKARTRGVTRGRHCEEVKLD